VKESSTSGDQGGMTAMLSVEECDPAAEPYSLITAVPLPSQPTGNTTPIQNKDGAETYSEITSIPAPPTPSGPGKETEGNSETTESDVHHTYSTIPDVHVAQKQKDPIYSLVQMH
ncbi:hypothetical protein NFI96_017437, partial [Prochilodus magdalenae]